MKNLLFILFAILLCSCKKYKEGPAISLRTKTNRITGTWKIEKLYINDIDSTSEYQKSDAIKCFIQEYHCLGDPTMRIIPYSCKQELTLKDITVNNNRPPDISNNIINVAGDNSYINIEPNGFPYKINLENKKAGLYYVRISTDSDIINKKIIIQ